MSDAKHTAEQEYKIAAGSALADFQSDKIQFSEWNRRQREAVAAYEAAKGFAA